MELRVKKKVVGPVATNCYVVYYEEDKLAVIVDPGEEALNIRSWMTQLGVTPGAILLTHGHFDHIGAVNELRKMYEIPVYALDIEKSVLITGKNLGSMVGLSNLSVDADYYVKDRETIRIGEMVFQVFHTPGHTEGSCCYYMEQEGVLFSGDTMFCGTYGRTDFPGGSQSAIIRSIKERLLTLPDDTMVYPGHQCTTTIGDERYQYG